MSKKKTVKTAKEKALDTALSQIEKQFGKGAVMKLGSESALNVESIPTGSVSLDMALGIGGLPKGRIIEIFGPESSGKTTVALHVVAEVQKLGGEAVFIDVEHALDPVYASALGVDINTLLVSQPDTGEQALEICEALVRSGAVDVVVLDSVAAMVTKAEIEGEMGDSHIGLQARLMSQALRKLAGVIAKSACMVIFINQLREKIGVVYGNPEVTPGGRALKFYSSVRLDIRRQDQIKDGTNVIGNRTRVRVVKNKVAPPFKEAFFDIMYGEGISREGEVLDLGAELDIIQKSGSWYSYGETRLGQGRDNVKSYMVDNPEFTEEIAKLIMENKDKLEKGRRPKGRKGGKKAQDDDADETDDMDEEETDEIYDDEDETDEKSGKKAPAKKPAKKAVVRKTAGKKDDDDVDDDDDTEEELVAKKEKVNVDIEVDSK